MNREEALVMLETAPRSDRPSKVNRNLTVTHVISMVRGWVENLPEGQKLNDLMTKRVYQATRNQRRPRY